MSRVLQRELAGIYYGLQKRNLDCTLVYVHSVEADRIAPAVQFLADMTTRELLSERTKGRLSLLINDE